MATPEQAALPGPGTAAVAAGLALVILAWQSIEVSEQYARFAASPLWLVPVAAWSGLFALFGKMARYQAASGATVRHMVGLALSVIVPAWLAVLCALLLIGPAVSSLGRTAYFTDPAAWNYLSNMVGWPALTLPGVFEFNNSRFLVNPVVAVFPAGIVIGLIALGCARTAQAKWVGLALAIGALAALASERVVTAQPGQIALAAGAAGLLAVAGLPGALLERRTSLRMWVLVGGGAVCALLGWRRPECQPMLSAAACPLAVAFTLAATQTRPGPLLRGIASQLRSWPALVIAFPVQQLASLWPPASSSAWVNLIAAGVPVLVVANIVGRLLGKALRQGLPGGADGGQSDNLDAAAGRSLRLRLPSRNALALALVIGAVAALLIAALALSIFSLQRMPWEN